MPLQSVDIQLPGSDQAFGDRFLALLAPFGSRSNNSLQLFPEGIADTALKNVWVYLKNPYGVDICLVIGEHEDGDWSDFFEGHRL